MFGLLVTYITLLFGSGGDLETSLSADTAELRSISINEVFVVGNKKTNENIILREMEIQQGVEFDYAELKKIVQRDKERIYNTQLFNTVEITVIEQTTESFDVLVEVNERWYTFPSPIIELVDRNFSDWWVNQNHDLTRINVGVKLYQLNIRGRNETLRLIAQLGYTKKIGINYTIPYVDKSQKNGLIMGFSYAENNNVAVRTDGHKREFLDSDASLVNTTRVGLTYRMRRTFYDYHYLDFLFRNITVQDTLGMLNEQYFSNDKAEQRLISIAYGYRKDMRDVIAYPLSGYMGEVSLRQMGLGIFDDVSYTSILGRYSKYFDLRNNFYLASHFATYMSTDKNISYNNYYGLGYDNYFVRGYELYLIEGRKFFLNKNSFKRLLFSTVTRLERAPLDQFKHFPLQIYLKAYFDWGYVENFPDYESNSFLTDRFLLGTGIGLDMVTAYDVVLRMEYSFNDLGESGFFFNIKKEF